MNSAITASLVVLRGSLSSEEPGARGFERLARNPDCTRLRALVMAGISPSTAAVQVYGEPDREGQSPFAIAIGNRFDRIVAENGASILLDLYRSKGRLATHECKVVIVPDVIPLTTPRNAPHIMALRHAFTRHLLLQKARGDASAPNLIVKPRIPVTFLGRDYYIEPDALVAADSDTFYQPIEVKSYPDRAGKTDDADVRGACRQAAVAVVALRNIVGRLGMPNVNLVVPSRGDLVFRKPGSLQASLRPMTLEGEVASLERALEEAPRNLVELVTILPAGASLDDRAVLDSITNSYRSGCKEFCALAQPCKRAALASGDPTVLGDFAREKLAAAVTISRSLDLMNGCGAPARTSAERLLQEQLQEALDQYRRAV